MTNAIDLKSDFQMTDKAWSYRKDTKNMTIAVKSECRDKARKVCSDIELALEYGAFPAAHALMIEKIGEANREGQPLACSMEFRP